MPRRWVACVCSSITSRLASITTLSLAFIRGFFALVSILFFRARVTLLPLFSCSFLPRRALSCCFISAGVFP
ncbi:hypothetical protein C8J57DRAFT_1357487 [Mycena rebaudengoi]|nr:hypothetical protein C8J57DRAFT_1357487 [Mycena rebaudengoi]